MLLHVLAHVEAQEGHAEALGELLGELGLPDARGAHEEEGADRLVLAGQARVRAAHGPRHRGDGFVLGEDHPLELVLEMLEARAVGRRRPRQRDRAIRATVPSISRTPTIRGP